VLTWDFRAFVLAIQDSFGVFKLVKLTYNLDFNLLLNSLIKKILSELMKFTHYLKQVNSQ